MTTESTFSLLGRRHRHVPGAGRLLLVTGRRPSIRSGPLPGRFQRVAAAVPTSGRQRIPRLPDIASVPGRCGDGVVCVPPSGQRKITRQTPVKAAPLIPCARSPSTMASRCAPAICSTCWTGTPERLSSPELSRGPRPHHASKAGEQRRAAGAELLRPRRIVGAIATAPRHRGVTTGDVPGRCWFLPHGGLLAT
jgi:hypothetical protein